MAETYFNQCFFLSALVWSEISLDEQNRSNTIRQTTPPLPFGFLFSVPSFYIGLILHGAPPRFTDVAIAYNTSVIPTPHYRRSFFLPFPMWHNLDRNNNAGIEQAYYLLSSMSEDSLVVP